MFYVGISNHIGVLQFSNNTAVRLLAVIGKRKCKIVESLKQSRLFAMNYPTKS